MCGIWLYSLLDSTRPSSFTDLYKYFENITHRGPDKSTLEIYNNIFVGFHRLAIMDLSVKGDQPFKSTYNLDEIIESYIEHSKIIGNFDKFVEKIWNNKVYLDKIKGNNDEITRICICNGEIYNYKELAKKYKIELKSNSDCEILLPLFNLLGIEQLCNELNGEYAFCILELSLKNNKNDMYIARDRFGIRPLFYSITDEFINFSSELKGIVPNNNTKEFTPGSYMILSNYTDNSSKKYKMIKNKKYYDLTTKLNKVDFKYNEFDDELKQKIRVIFTDSVINKLSSDRPMGCLLSGGLDSSLVAAIAARELKKHGKQLQTFSIGLDDSTDEKYARLVAEHIGSKHTHVKFEQKDFIDAIPEVIKATETFDITTVRASTGQYLISKYIKNNTNIKVLLIGDGSDELTAGYMYFHKAPSDIELHNENIRLLNDISYFDVLRADRGIASNGLEARVPFLDHNFVDLYLDINPSLRNPKNNKNIEKYILREAFNCASKLPDTLIPISKNQDFYRSITYTQNIWHNLLPQEVLFRKKEAFSDGVSSVNKSWYQILQEHIDTIYDDKYLQSEIMRLSLFENKNVIPHSKEALYYRKLWEKYFGCNLNTPNVIPYFWLPKWSGNIKEPSARVLDVYQK